MRERSQQQALTYDVISNDCFIFFFQSEHNTTADATFAKNENQGANRGGGFNIRNTQAASPENFESLLAETRAEIMRDVQRSKRTPNTARDSGVPLRRPRKRC